MIRYSENSREFHLATSSMSYIAKISDHGHLLGLHCGARLGERKAFPGLGRGYSPGLGNLVAYTEEDPEYSLDTERLEYPTSGKGDYREPALEARMADGSSILDFRYVSHSILKGKPALAGLPSSCGEGLETLEVLLEDKIAGLEMTLSYTPFEDSEVMARSLRVRNTGSDSVRLERVMSMSLDLDRADLAMTSLDGKWIAEAQPHARPVAKGVAFVDSKKGLSGSYHNPFIALAGPGADEVHGEAWGLALLYSGNWRAQAELSPHEVTRVQIGLNPWDFSWSLGPGESFQAPEAILTYSTEGFGGMSRNLHRFIRHHVVPAAWRDRERPILVNNWEATYFAFDEAKLLALAGKARDLGLELFVLDDGWFGKRDDDRSSLGDWTENKSKLPGGLEGFGRKIKAMGLKFGLWVEPEAVSADSGLHRAHPGWVLRQPGREPSLGRHQLTLDLANPEVVDYLYGVLSALFERSAVDYVKWDMNRNLSDLWSPALPAWRQPELAHRYVLGLYSLVSRLSAAFPGILFEACAAGGNRFDLGMLSYMPQAWVSDDSDAIERLGIQHGYSLAYPPSVMGAHVSGAPNHQVLRTTPFETRFNVAAFGLLGYELDLTRISPAEGTAIEAQVAFYREHRRLLQFGEFHRLASPFEGRHCLWMVVSEDRSEAILGYFQSLQAASPPLETWRLEGLDPDALYDIVARPQVGSGAEGGPAASEAGLSGDGESYTAYGDELMYVGWKPVAQFTGTGTGKGMHVIGDFGSRLYLIRRRPS